MLVARAIGDAERACRPSGTGRSSNALVRQRPASTIYLQNYKATGGAQTPRGVDDWVCLAG